MAFDFGNNFKLKRSPGGGFPPPHTSFDKFLALPPLSGEKTLNKKEILATKKRKTRSLLDIGWTAPPPQRYSPATAADSGVGEGLYPTEKVQEGDRARRRRRWEALLDVAAVATIREYEGNLGREDVEFRAENQIRNPRKSATGSGGEFVNWLSGGDRRPDTVGDVAVTVAAPPPPPLPRSKRGRVLALPNKYKDSALMAAAAKAEDEEEFPRRRKLPAATTADGRKSRRCA